MPMVGTLPRDPNQEALAQGAAGLGQGIGAYLMHNRLEKRLNEDRTIVEDKIKNAGSYQDALTVIDNAPFKVKEKFNEQLHLTAKDRFPEQELINVLDTNGNLKSIPQTKNKPLSDEEINAQGYKPARQMAIVSTDEKGDIEVHDSALGMDAANQDMARLQEMFPKRKFQLAQGPEIDTMFKIRDQKLRQQDIEKQRQGAEHHPSVEEIKLMANVRAEMENDPLVTQNGATVLESKRDEVATRFKDFNGKFAGNVFSLEDPESKALVQNGVVITSKAIGRGANLEKATELGFNQQIAGSVVSNLMKGGALDNGVVKETQQRFGVEPATLNDIIGKVPGYPQFANLPEYTPKDPAIFGIPTGDVVVQFVKIGGKVVPFGYRKR